METSIVKAQRALLLMQLFSTLGFSVIYSTLILYATMGLHLEDHYATALTAGFIAFNYSLHVLGGYIGGRFMSYRLLFIVGMLLSAAGCAILSIQTSAALILGLSVFLSGCGLNVICINCMLTQLFEPHDKRRESAFLWNYSGMNLGFLMGFSMSGYFQLQHNFHTLFLFSAFGNLISFFLALGNWKHLRDKDTAYSNAKNKNKRILVAFLIIFLLLISLLFLLKSATLSNRLIAISGVAIALLFSYLAWKQPSPENSKKMWAFLILALSSVLFWTLYQMAPIGLTLFFERNVQTTLLGIKIPPQWLQNINTLIIILGGPLMASINLHLRKKGYKITVPFQFTTALFIIGIGFLLLPLGIHFADAEGISSISWMIGCYICQSVGELFISPIGYALVGQLIPSRLQGIAMGTWLMVTGVAATLSNFFSQSALGSSDLHDPLVTNPTYSAAFIKLGLSSIAASLAVFFLRKFLHRLIQEKPSLKNLEPAPYNAHQE